MSKLDQKVAVVTGGARGIGKQICLTFASEGADIVIGDIIGMDATAREIRKLGRKVITVKVDVTKKQEVTNLIDAAIDKFGKVDILVNDAGIVRRASLLELSEEDWDATMNVDLKGVFLCTQAAAKHMIERKYGKIINMGSISGLLAAPGVTASYSVAKAGVIHLTRVCARELGPYGINVNAIAPGVIVTEIFADRPDAKQFIEGRKKLSVLGRVGTTQDIAAMALFLASDESSYITGQVIPVDGGRVGLG